MRIRTKPAAKNHHSRRRQRPPWHISRGEQSKHQSVFLVVHGYVFSVACPCPAELPNSAADRVTVDISSRASRVPKFPTPHPVRPKRKTTEILTGGFFDQFRSFRINKASESNISWNWHDAVRNGFGLHSIFQKGITFFTAVVEQVRTAINFITCRKRGPTNKTHVRHKRRRTPLTAGLFKPS